MDYGKRSKHQQNIDKFMRLANQVVPVYPMVPDEPTRILRVRLILEEAFETAEAFGVQVGRKGGFNTPAIIFEDLQFQIVGECDLVKVVDGCADISVVTIGTLSACGVSDCAVLETVDLNNLAKFGPGGHRDPETGKWIKPKDHPVPDIPAVLNAMLRLAIDGRRNDGT